jgi:Tfp pilus assembly protein PilF
MKRKITILSLIVLAIFGLLSSNLVAQNKQDYNMNNIEAEHYIQLSRELIEKDNLPLAKVYAKKAVKSNVWSAKAWANYDDIIQKIADNGEIEEFETFIERSKEASMPSASDGGSKFEGC